MNFDGEIIYYFGQINPNIKLQHKKVLLDKCGFTEEQKTSNLRVKYKKKTDGRLILLCSVQAV